MSRKPEARLRPTRKDTASPRQKAKGKRRKAQVKKNHAPRRHPPRLRQARYTRPAREGCRKTETENTRRDTRRADDGKHRASHHPSFDGEHGASHQSMVRGTVLPVFTVAAHLLASSRSLAGRLADG